MAVPMEVSLPQTMLQKLLDLLKLESLRPHQEIAIQSIIQDQKDAVICVPTFAYDLLSAAICGESPELSETDAERSTEVPLLSAAESNSIRII